MKNEFQYTFGTSFLLRAQGVVTDPQLPGDGLQLYGLTMSWVCSTLLWISCYTRAFQAAKTAQMLQNNTNSHTQPHSSVVVWGCRRDLPTDSVWPVGLMLPVAPVRSHRWHCPGGTGACSDALGHAVWSNNLQMGGTLQHTLGQALTHHHHTSRPNIALGL